jgi:NADP-dependent 3-hydroxy acid dehydrogenase YdfG
MPSTIFVVGAGPQIGLQVAILFASKGFTSVGLASRSKSSLESLASKLPQGTKVAIADGTDAGDTKSLLHGLTSLQQSLGKPDVVVYNPSSLFLGLKPLKDLTVEEFETHLRVTTTGG